MPHPHRTRVLAADDNADFVESLAALLRLDGYEVAIAYEGRSALEVAQSFRPHVVILDIGLPGLTGFELARALRKLPTAGAMRLIALSAYSGAAVQARARRADIDHYLVKPADPADIEALIEALIEASG